MNCSPVIHIEESYGISRVDEPVCIGIPLPKGFVKDASLLLLQTVKGDEKVFQPKSLLLWADGSIRWLLVDFLVTIPAKGLESYLLKKREEVSRPVISSFTVKQTDNSVEVCTGQSIFHFYSGKSGFLFGVTVDDSNQPFLPCHLSYTDPNGSLHSLDLKSVEILETGPVCTKIMLKGEFRLHQRKINIECSVDLFAGTGLCRAEIAIHNPSAALHPGGIWDLGDPGSIRFSDLSLVIKGIDSANTLEWQSEPTSDICSSDEHIWVLYQDSSGGANWNSPNHIGADAKSTVSFPGYRVYSGNDSISPVYAGERAVPWVKCKAGEIEVAAGVERFWQNFPKAMRKNDDELSIALFPRESVAGFELQGGERKRHVVWMQFDNINCNSLIPGMLQPLSVKLNPDWIENSKALSYFVAESRDPETEYLDYVKCAISGSNSFFSKRESIDEYGWRNFGDLYADHEAAFHAGPELYPSHYNNQYDFIYGTFCHFLRSGDQHWRELMSDLVRHVSDIDIYHTEEDRSAYNNGQFWHSYHYQPAGTGTHRGFTKINIPNGHEPFYGGGPSNEQNYSSGLFHYHLLSGDSWARETVLSLAKWVIAMDDGAQTLLGLLDNGPTGLASQTGSTDYHHPGRGAANCINTLLDAYSLTRQRNYFDKLEELIRRCIHPRDQLEDLKLDEPEIRWFYLVFLQILAKYLDAKVEMEEHDYNYFYARDSLLHYAKWVYENEVPYKDVLHKVEYPTETWSAQDVRKASVLNLAAKYAPSSEIKRAYRSKAHFFFTRCLQDLLTFETAFFTRPMVLLAVYGTQQGYFDNYPDEFVPYWNHIHDFGKPTTFRNQRQRVKDSFKLKLQVTMQEGRRLLISKAVEKFSLLRAFLGNRASYGE